MKPLSPPHAPVDTPDERSGTEPTVSPEELLQGPRDAGEDVAVKPPVQFRSIHELGERLETLRIEFLNADLDLAFTLCHTAEIATDPEHRARLGETVREAIDTVRALNRRVANHEKSAEIERRLADLEARTNSLWPATP